MIEHPGFILWFTGLSGAGKSTLSGNIASQLKTRGYRVELLDGDEVRTHLSKGLGFSKEDRDTNVRRIGYVARLLARNGVIAITAAISPYAETRNLVRAEAETDETPFVEVFVECSIERLTERDVKGLYKRALAGEIAHFTGITDPYEPPVAPEIHVDSSLQSPDESLDTILHYLDSRSLLRAQRPLTVTT